MIERRIPLDLNESYWLLDEEWYGTCLSSSRIACTTYPDYTTLTEAIASYVGCSERSIALAPGSDAAIEAVVLYCAQQGMRALFPLPTFKGYERVLTYTPLKHERIYYVEQDGAFVFPLQETLAHISNQDIDVVFLCEPNNPLGYSLPQEEYDAILDAARDKGILLVIDEAYSEFTGRSATARIHSQPLIIFRTFSKAFGLPGMRLGYTVASPKLAPAIAPYVFGKLPWPITGLTAHLALAVLAQTGNISARRRLVIDERERFSEALRGIRGLHVYPSFANFVLVRTPDARRVAAALAEKGIAVALAEDSTTDAQAAQLLVSTLRITVPSPEHSPIVTDAVRAVLYN